MDTAYLHLNKNLSITFHIFPWHYKLWDELVRNSVWNRKKTNWKQGEIFTVQSAFLQYVIFTVYIYIYSHFTIYDTFTVYGTILQDMALFHTIFFIIFCI
jgi:hypothetical protein